MELLHLTKIIKCCRIRFHKNPSNLSANFTQWRIDSLIQIKVNSCWRLSILHKTQALQRSTLKLKIFTCKILVAILRCAVTRLNWSKSVLRLTDGKHKHHTTQQDWRIHFHQYLKDLVICDNHLELDLEHLHHWNPWNLLLYPTLHPKYKGERPYSSK